jgi:hypothetical protein
MLPSPWMATISFNMHSQLMHQNISCFDNYNLKNKKWK